MLENPHTFLVACPNYSLSVKNQNRNSFCKKKKCKKVKFLGISASQLDIRDNEHVWQGNLEVPKMASLITNREHLYLFPLRNLTVPFLPQKKKGVQLKIEPNKKLIKALQRLWYMVRRLKYIKSHRQKNQEHAILAKNDILDRKELVRIPCVPARLRNSFMWPAKENFSFRKYLTLSRQQFVWEGCVGIYGSSSWKKLRCRGLPLWMSSLG